MKKQKVANVAKVSEAGKVGDRLGKRFTVGTVEGWAGHGEELEFIWTRCSSSNGFYAEECHCPTHA